MGQVKIRKYLASVVVCSLLLAAGCAPPGEEVAKPKVEIEKQTPKVPAEKSAIIALKFNPKDSTTYKVITRAERNIKWEGDLPEEPTFKGGRNYNRHEMTFTQEIQSVDDRGNAIAKITIDGLKYLSIVKDDAAYKFDSAKPKDPNHPLAKLIGQSYTIKIAPTGEVIEVIDTKEAEMAARGGTTIPATALRRLRPEVIKERHGNLILPDAEKNQLHIGDNWSNKRSFDFGMLGSESYEKIYTLNQIKNQDNRQIAVVEMDAIPASETPEEQSAKFLKRSDNTKTYTGELEIDLTAGKVRKYREKLQQEWTVDFSSSEQEPVILTMSATRFYSLEKVD